MTREMNDDFDFEKYQDEAIAKLRAGGSGMGKDGVLIPLLKRFLDKALEAEMDEHMDAQERKKGNRRNGKMSKTIKTNSGDVQIDTPRDRNGSFEPQIINKRETILADNLSDKIIGLYAKGMTTRDISQTLFEMYDTTLSATTISNITNKILPELKEWRERPLNEVYSIVWMDAVHFKVRNSDGILESKAVYNLLGINPDGEKEILGFYTSENEGAKYWMQILSELQSRGVKDILIACIDNLTGFGDAIEAVYPKTEVQLCIVHQIRNSLKYISNEDSRPFMKELKTVYKAPSKKLAEDNLDLLEEKYGEKYPIVIKSWRENWDRLTEYFKYPAPIRRLVYTTNPIEGVHRQIRKVTKNKGAFTNEQALEKIIYLALRDIQKKWTSKLQHWATTSQQLRIIFGDRMPMDI